MDKVDKNVKKLFKKFEQITAELAPVVENVLKEVKPALEKAKSKFDEIIDEFEESVNSKSNKRCLKVDIADTEDLLSDDINSVIEIAEIMDGDGELLSVHKTFILKHDVEINRNVDGNYEAFYVNYRIIVNFDSDTVKVYR